jgi:hypothetical protein
MGWGRMLLLGNVGQQLDIDDLSGVIDQMRSAVTRNDSVDREQGRSIEQLRSENHELKLYLATLVRLLVARGILKAEEVETLVRAIEPQ